MISLVKKEGRNRILVGTPGWGPREKKNIHESRRVAPTSKEAPSTESGTKSFTAGEDRLSGNSVTKSERKKGECALNPPDRNRKGTEKRDN